MSRPEPTLSTPAPGGAFATPAPGGAFAIPATGNVLPEAEAEGARARPSRSGESASPEATQLDRLFSALADPTRRAVLARLSAGPLSAGELAEPFGMALPSFMEHLRRLETGGLIETWKDGRSRMCRLRPGALSPVRGWMEVQRALWEARLDNLEVFLAQLLKESDP